MPAHAFALGFGFAPAPNYSTVVAGATVQVQNTLRLITDYTDFPRHQVGSGAHPNTGSRCIETPDNASAFRIMSTRGRH